MAPQNHFYNRMAMEKINLTGISAIFTLLYMSENALLKRSTLGNVSVHFPTLQLAQFIERENRFRVKIQLGNICTSAHLANPGRLQELLVRDAEIWVSKAQNPKRRTQYSLELVKTNNTLVSVNSQIPNALVDNALKNYQFPDMPDYKSYRGEVPYGNSRLDFCIFHKTTLTWLEVKSVTLVRKRIATFPDAPTLRGQRHLRELIAAVQKGTRSMVAFVVQREDAVAFSPNDTTDPAFSQLLREADLAGVDCVALGCTVTTKDISLNHLLPVIL